MIICTTATATSATAATSTSTAATSTGTGTSATTATAAVLPRVLSSVRCPLEILGYVSYGLVLEKIKVSIKKFLFYVNLRLLVNGVPVPSNKF